jgi:hypothetical protein
MLPRAGLAVAIASSALATAPPLFIIDGDPRTGP